MSVTVVIPSAGRESLRRVVARVAGGAAHVIVVDDRPEDGAPLLPDAPPGVTVLVGPARGPAAARNAGWRLARADWIAFLDDDVVPQDDWLGALDADLGSLPGDVAASQGRIHVPLPNERRPTDWERNVAGLESARWATADMAYRRSVLAAVGGFDERFPRAYREDADLGLRVTEAGWRIVRGARHVSHPVRPADPWASVRLQRGNADDAVMRRLHGREWRARAGAAPGRFRRHAGLVAAAGFAVGSWQLAGVRSWQLAAVAGGAWLAGTGEFAWARIAPGPRTRTEITRMVATSALLPFAAVAWRAYGELQARQIPPLPSAICHLPSAICHLPSAVLLDRDGTLIHDRPPNADPALVTPLPGAREALARLRAAGIALGVVSNQGGVASGRLTLAQVDAVNARVEELVGPFDAWAVCPHGPDDGCACRKPRPGLVIDAAAQLGVAPERCAVVGDIGADVEAARAAGARSVLVPTPVTRSQEVDAAPAVARDLGSAVDLLLGRGAR